MKVYIAMDFWQEDDSILGVFSTEEKAREYANRNAGNAPHVEQYEVDEQERSEG